MIEFFIAIILVGIVIVVGLIVGYITARMMFG